jgi:hypothetical protein
MTAHVLLLSYLSFTTTVKGGERERTRQRERKFARAYTHTVCTLNAYIHIHTHTQMYTSALTNALPPMSAHPSLNSHFHNRISKNPIFNFFGVVFF